jgi:hypothetical protein
LSWWFAVRRCVGREVFWTRVPVWVAVYIAPDGAIGGGVPGDHTPVRGAEEKTRSTMVRRNVVRDPASALVPVDDHIMFAVVGSGFRQQLSQHRVNYR